MRDRWGDPSPRAAPRAILNHAFGALGFATPPPHRRYADNARHPFGLRPHALTPSRPYAISSRYSREFFSLDIELQIVQPAIHRRGVQKLAMGTNFSDLTSLHDDDLVGL